MAALRAIHPLGFWLADYKAVAVLAEDVVVGDVPPAGDLLELLVGKLDAALLCELENLFGVQRLLFLTFGHDSRLSPSDISIYEEVSSGATGLWDMDSGLKVKDESRRNPFRSNGLRRN